MDYSQFIREVPDFPRPGILFKDITPLLQNGPIYKQAISDLCNPFKGERIDQVVAIEARGYLLGAPMAVELEAGIIPVRKQGKLPFETVRAKYTLEYGESVIEIHRDSLISQDRVIVVDDVLATGGTLAATIELIEGLGAEIVGIAVLIELQSLRGGSLLGNHALTSLIRM